MKIRENQIMSINNFIYKSVLDTKTLSAVGAEITKISGQCSHNQD